MKRLFFTMLIVSIALTVWSFGQMPSLSESPQYVRLQRVQDSLRVMEDSIGRHLSALRQQFSQSEVNRDSLSSVILNAENKLYSVRSAMAAAAASINALEQEYLMGRLKSSSSDSLRNDSVKSSFKTYRMLADNPFFRQNLSAKDYQSLRSFLTLQPRIDSVVQQYIMEYDSLKRIGTAYQVVNTQEAADELYARYVDLKKLITLSEDTLGKLWNNCYQSKVFIYSYLLDKTNRTEALSKMNKQVSALRSVGDPQSVNSIESQSFALYPRERLIILDFELTLARALSLNEAADSLSATVTAAMQPNALLFDKVELTPRDFTRYSNITTRAEDPYSLKNPIPLHTAPRTDLQYKILVGSFLKPQPFSIFRGVSPMTYEKSEDGRYRYYAGVYREQIEALKDVALLRKLGFKRPEVVVWEKGVYRVLPSQTAAGDEVYRLEIYSSESTLPDAVQALLDEYAADKETSRVDDSEGGFIFIVGNFDKISETQTLTEKLSQVPDLKYKVVPLR